MTAIPVLITWFLKGRHTNKKVINDIRIQIEKDNALNEARRIERLQKMSEQIEGLYDEKADLMKTLSTYEIKLNQYEQYCKGCITQ